MKRMIFLRYKKEIKKRLSLENQNWERVLVSLLVVTVGLFLVSLIFNKPGGSSEGRRIAYDPSIIAIDTNIYSQIQSMVKGYPIESMTRYIAQKDQKVAAFLVSIAKKESNWGKRVPKLNGQDCYNYWGFRKQTEKITPSGYSCFDTPEQAVDVVGERIRELVKEQNLDSPQKMIVWKCGSTCAGHSLGSVSKWISDVGYYFNQLIK